MDEREIQRLVATITERYKGQIGVVAGANLILIAAMEEPLPKDEEDDVKHEIYQRYHAMGVVPAPIVRFV